MNELNVDLAVLAVHVAKVVVGHSFHDVVVVVDDDAAVVVVVVVAAAAEEEGDIRNWA